MDVATPGQIVDFGTRMTGTDHRHVSRRFGAHQHGHAVVREQWLGCGIEFCERDHRVHAGSFPGHQFDIDQSDPTPPFAHRGDQTHRTRIRSRQEVRRHRDRMHGGAALRPVGLAGGFGAQCHHHAAVDLGADGPVFVEVSVELTRPAGGRAQGHRVGEQWRRRWVHQFTAAGGFGRTAATRSRARRVRLCCALPRWSPRG